MAVITSQHWDGAKITEEVRRAAGRGVYAGAIFLTARVKEILSEPAPRKRVLGHRGASAGVLRYVAATPAIPGAPPRKLTGVLRQRTSAAFESDGLTARIVSSAPQALRLEHTGHPFLSVALERFRSELAVIMGRAMKLGG